MLLILLGIVNAWVFWIGVLVGILLIVAVLIYRKRVADTTIPHIYINAVIHNKSKVLKEQVRSKLPDPFKMGQRSFLKRKIAGLADSMVSDQKFTELLAAGVAEEAPTNMKRETDLDASCELLFVKDAYFVLKISLHTINSEEFIAKKLENMHKPGLIKRIGWIYSYLIGTGSRRQWLDKNFTELVSTKVQKDIGKSMEYKLKLKANAEVDVTALMPAQQADFFYTMLQTIAEHNAAKKA